MNIQLRFISLVILLIFSALFSGSEASLFSLRRWRLDRLVREGIGWAKRARLLLADPWKLLMTILLGNDLVNIIISNLAANLRRELFAPYGSWAIFPAALATLFSLLLLGEIMPKVIAVSRPEKFSRFTSPLVNGFSLLVSPITYPAVKMLKSLSSLFPLPDYFPKKMGAEEIKALLRISQQEGSLSPFEVESIETIFSFSQQAIRYIMIPRAFMHCLPITIDMRIAEDYMKRNKLPYIPIYRESYDDILGILTAGNVIRAKLGLIKEKNLLHLLKQPLLVPQSLKVMELLSQLEENSAGVALVIDEYGGTAGIIDRSQIFQRLMEHLSIQAQGVAAGMEKIGEDRYAVDAQITIPQLNQLLGRKIEDNMAYTLGGHILNLFGRFPHRGESIEADQLIYTVAKLEGTRLKKIIIQPIKKGADRGKDREEKA